MMMSMVRLKRAQRVMYGGSILPGRWKGRDVTVQDLFEAVGKHSSGQMDEEELHQMECVTCPSAGSCAGQFTANTMACVSEAMGLALPGSAGRAGALREPRRLCRGLGPRGDGPAGHRPAPARHRQPARRWRTPPPWSRPRAVRPTPRCTCRRSPTSAASTSTCTTWPRCSAAPPTSPTSSRVGRYVAKDMFEIGGVPVLLRELLDGGYLHGRLHHRDRQRPWPRTWRTSSSPRTRTWFAA